MALTSDKAQGWSSNWGFILASIGSAVGLGNLWRFPSEAGSHGGGAFVVFYIFCVVLIGLPLLLSEMLIGRHGRASAVASTQRVAKESGATRHWGALASVGMWGAFIILTFYSVVAGWVLYYIGLFAADLFNSGFGGAFAGQEREAVAGLMGGLFQNGTLMIGLHALFMAITVFVVARGVTGGIEKVAVWLMPTFFALFLAITIYSLFNGAASETLAFLFSFKPERLLHADVMSSALGQAFFSLSLGSALMITYGAYADRRTNLASTSATVAFADTSVAIVAGLAIFPIVFATMAPGDAAAVIAGNADAPGGPTLMFSTLPTAFMDMPAGALIGLVFFIMVFFAALTSSVALLEAPVARAMEVFGNGRAVTALLVGTVALLIGVMAALSMSGDFNFNPLGGLEMYQNADGSAVNFFDFLDRLSGRILLPLSGFLTAIFIGWVADRRLTDEENGISGGLHLFWRFLVAWLCPLAVGFILLVGIFPGIMD